ncbi:hypothetical protein AgCh_025836 [Apium graveolens]
MKTSTWFYNYWLSQQHEDNDFFVYDEDDLEDIIDLLPDAIDLGIEKEIFNMKIQFEHFIQLSEAEAGNKKLSSYALKETPRSGTKSQIHIAINKVLGESSQVCEPKNPVIVASSIRVECWLHIAVNKVLGESSKVCEPKNPVIFASSIRVKCWLLKIGSLDSYLT